jgi:hypothetical protein
MARLRHYCVRSRPGPELHVTRVTDLLGENGCASPAPGHRSGEERTPRLLPANIDGMPAGGTLRDEFLGSTFQALPPASSALTQIQYASRPRAASCRLRLRPLFGATPLPGEAVVPLADLVMLTRVRSSRQITP